MNPGQIKIDCPLSPGGEGAGLRSTRSLALLAQLAFIIVFCSLSPALAGERAGEAIVTNQLSDSVSVVDTATMKTVGEIKLLGKPAGIALSPEKKIAFVTAPDGKILFEIDIEKRTVLRTLDVGSGPLGIAAHPVRPELFVADWYAHKIFVVSTAAYEVPNDSQPVQPTERKLLVLAEIQVGQSPSGLAVTPDGKWLLSADRDSNQVSFIDIESRKVAAAVPVGERPFGITVSADGTSAYTANVGSDDVTVIDVASRAVRGSVKVGRRPYAVALSGDKGFVTDQYAGTITVFDIENLKTVKTIEACDHPEGIEATDGAVYVACWGDNLLLKIDAGSLAVTGKVEVGDGPRAFGTFLR